MSIIIFLNGCSSAGKTSIARAIQYLSNESYLSFGIDTFINMAPYPYSGKSDTGYFTFIPGQNSRGPTMHIIMGPRQDQLFGSMPVFANLLAHKKNNIVIDEVLLDDARLISYLHNLSGHTVYFIGVFCDLVAMQEREILRRDRALGLANDQIDRVHTGMREYDLTVDTTYTSPFSIAQCIISFTKTNPIPQGFISMRNNIPK